MRAPTGRSIGAPRPGPPSARLDSAAVVAVGAAVTGMLWFWASCWLAGLIARGRRLRLPVDRLLPAVGHLPSRVSDPLRAWPASIGGRPPPGEGLAFYTAALVVGAGLAAVAVGAARLWGAAGSSPRRSASARWAGPGDVGPITLRSTSRDRRGRVVVGRLLGRGGRAGRLVATEARHSLLVLGPTQSGKTSALAIPAILEWDGPVVATSVKDDLAGRTLPWRAGRGPCAVFDPTRVEPPGVGATVGPYPCSRWSPLSACETWSAAQKMATWLVEATPGRRGLADAAFWYTTAAKLLAPMMLAARHGGIGMAEVVRWIDTEDYAEPARLLQAAGEVEAGLALTASAGRDDRIRSSVATTLETVLAPFEDPAVAAATAVTDIPPGDILDGRGTLYLCGPTHEQHRVQGLFAALVSIVVAEAVRRATRQGGPLDPPLLLVLDEAANIAPVPDLDSLASTAAGLGIQLVTVCQDLAQLAHRYDAERARTIANNHRAKLLLSGVSDLGTLDLISGLAGEHAVVEESRTWDLHGGGGTRSTATALRRLAPTDQLRRIEPGDGVLVYGHLPPARVRLRPWYDDRRLRERGRPG